MHQKTRLQIGLTFKSNATQTSFSYVSPTKHDGQHLDRSLQAAQTEIVDQEIFALLVRDAANLPAVPSRVSERFINIDAALGVELTFSLVRIMLDYIARISPSSSLGRQRALKNCEEELSGRVQPL